MDRLSTRFETSDYVSQVRYVDQMYSRTGATTRPVVCSLCKLVTNCWAPEKFRYYWSCCHLVELEIDINDLDKDH